jgi:rhamnose utilization protein RhaD (predicted bifunctional aldolase and dehydrogenase)
MHRKISKFCAEIGKNKLLVQGAGGNVSWKDGDTLWIKGSGAWLSDAIKNEIFVPVNLVEISKFISTKNFDIELKINEAYRYKPSIETTLHALMPQTFVAHLHSVEALRYLVLPNAKAIISRLFSKANIDSQKIAFVDYFKPGAQLAKIVHEIIKKSRDINIIFLRNHGIVVGANSLNEVEELIHTVIATCSGAMNNKNNEIHENIIKTVIEPKNGYIPLPDSDVQKLALNPYLLKRLKHEWVLYPDHAVFLGANAHLFSSWDHFLSIHSNSQETPELIFIQDGGVFIKPHFNQAKLAQLRCYYDVISRVENEEILKCLTSKEVDELLNWDAEKNRREISK